MNFKHTQGPWELNAGRTINTPSGEFFISYGYDKAKNPLFRNFVELDQNARLIAAAPELLAALQACSCFWGSDGLYDSPVAKQARAAIDKALGQ